MKPSEIKLLFAERAEKKNEYDFARNDEYSTVGRVNLLKQEMDALDKKFYAVAKDLFYQFQHFVGKHPDLYAGFYPGFKNGQIESFKIKESKQAFLIKYSQTYEYPDYYSLLIPYDFLTDPEAFIIKRKRYLQECKIKAVTEELENIPLKITELKQREQALLLKRQILLDELTNS